MAFKGRLYTYSTHPLCRLMTHIVFFFAYLCAGALVFMVLERPEEDEIVLTLRHARRRMLEENDCITGRMKINSCMEKFVSVYLCVCVGGGGGREGGEDGLILTSLFKYQIRKEMCNSFYRIQTLLLRLQVLVSCVYTKYHFLQTTSKY